MNRYIRRLKVPIITLFGLILRFAFPPFNLFFLPFLIFPALFILLRENRWVENLFYFILFFLIFIIFNSLWAGRVIGLYYILFTIIPVILYSLAVLPLHFLKSPVLKILVIPFTVTIVEIVIILFFYYPPLTIGYTQTNNFLLQGPCFFMDTRIYTFLVMLISMIIYTIFVSNDKTKKIKFGVLIFAILVILTFMSILKKHYNPPDIKDLCIVSIKPEGKSIMPCIRKHKNVDIMILPEYAIPFDIVHDQEKFKILSGITREKGCYLVFGYVEVRDGSRYNVIGNISPEGELIQRHYKHHLIPVSEYDMAKSVPDINENTFYFNFNKQYAGGIITCLEIHYPDVLNGFGKEIDFFIVPNMIHPDWGKRPVQDMINSAKFLSRKYNRKVILAGEYEPTMTVLK